MKKKFLYFIVFIIISFLFTYQVLSLIENRKKEYLQSEKELIKITYDTVIEAFRVHTAILYQSKIDTKDVKEILSPIYDVSLEEKNKIRKELYEELIDTYKNIDSFHLKQLHFHLKNNESFLRFHRPNKFSDDLSSIRLTVAYVNRTHKAIHGFEEGRIFNGYRFVYPLSYENRYLGSVETSVSMESILKQFRDKFDGDVDFIIDKSVVNKKVFNDEKNNYTQCKTSKNFYHEKSISKGGSNLIDALVANYMKDHSMEQKFQQNSPFNFFIKEKNDVYITTFFPIKHAISQKTIGYIIVANKHNGFITFQNKYLFLLAVVIFILSIIMYFIYRLDKVKQFLAHQNDLLKEIQKIGHIGYWEHDLQENKIQCSEGIARLLGLKKSECNPSFEEFIKNIHPEDIKQVRTTYLESLKNKNDYCIEYRIITKTGLTKHVSVDAHHRFDENEKVIRSLGTIRDISAIKIYQNKIEKSKAHFESLMSHIPDIVYKCKNDEDFTMLYLNGSIYSITGYTEKELIDNDHCTFASIIYPDDLPKIIDALKNMVFENHTKTILEYRIVTKSSEIIWVKDSFEIVKEGNDIFIEGIISDITAQKEAYSKLQKFIDTQENMVILTDGEKINFANKSFFDFFEYSDIDEFAKEHKCVCEYFICDDRFFHLGKINKDDNWVCELKKLPILEQIVMIEDSACVEHIFSVTITAFEENLLIVNFVDTSDTIFEKFELENKSVHDKLTNAYNREYFDQNYKKLISRSSNNNTQLGIAILDIDFFKKVNDKFGHDVGDYVLVELVEKIHTFSRTEDILIRWGGEEFLLLLQIESYEGLFKALDNIRKIIENHYFEDVKKVTVSIGATIYTKNEPIETTIKRADNGLYKSKEEGRNRVTINS